MAHASLDMVRSALAMELEVLHAEIRHLSRSVADAREELAELRQRLAPEPAAPDAPEEGVLPEGRGAPCVEEEPQDPFLVSQVRDATEGRTDVHVSTLAAELRPSAAGDRRFEIRVAKALRYLGFERRKVMRRRVRRYLWVRC